ncbi:MAG: cytochrome c3 family protein, partial [bacterium]
MGTKCFIPCIVIVSLLLILSGCETLKASKPIVPIKEYERMIVGRIDANYVGTKTCLQSCHFHDKQRRDFEASTMGAQLSSKSGMPLVDCESCHGPGSLAIEGLTEEKVRQDKENGIETKCKYDALNDLKNLPAPAKSLICLKCHTANATFNLHNWNASTHNINDVSCSDCHNIHAGPDLIVRPRDTFKMCFQCHQDIEAEFSLPSHHPIHEKRIFCVDCHDAHGTITAGNMREQTVKATCTKCHGEKEGPFT